MLLAVVIIIFQSSFEMFCHFSLFPCWCCFCITIAEKLEKIVFVAVTVYSLVDEKTVSIRTGDANYARILRIVSTIQFWRFCIDSIIIPSRHAQRCSSSMCNFIFHDIEFSSFANRDNVNANVLFLLYSISAFHVTIFFVLPIHLFLLLMGKRHVHDFICFTMHTVQVRLANAHRQI